MCFQWETSGAPERPQGKRRPKGTKVSSTHVFFQPQSAHAGYKNWLNEDDLLRMERPPLMERAENSKGNGRSF